MHEIKCNIYQMHEIKCNVHLEWTYWSFKNTMWNSSISTHAVNTDAIVQVIYLLLVWAAWVRSSAHKIAVLLHRNVAYRTRSSPAPNTLLQSSCKTHTRPVTTSLNTFSELIKDWMWFAICLALMKMKGCFRINYCAQQCWGVNLYANGYYYI